MNDLLKRHCVIEEYARSACRSGQAAWEAKSYNSCNLCFNRFASAAGVHERAGLVSVSGAKQTWQGPFSQKAVDRNFDNAGSRSSFEGTTWTSRRSAVDPQKLLSAK